MSDRILVVEDDEQLGAQIVERLSGEGYAPTWLKDGSEAARTDPKPFSLVILDLMLPGTYGMDVLKRIRASSDVPVLILTARDHPADKVRGLELGADDYVTKPFWPEELLARVKARLRRPVMSRVDRVSVGALTVDLAARVVEVNGAPIELTKVEFDLLAVLVRRPGQAISRRALVEKVLDPEKQGTERTLDVHVSRLRKKLGDEGARVATVWGIGYRFEHRDAEEGDA
ncbi:MAG: response regulator transcription factor [Sandaracinaceae bacterium]|nr:MAG: response regulator transcription factor [Sandaracinaceae bacterium]HBQ16430.1 DNA-binding response regulator [Myxococcales bacterium]